MTNAPFCMDIFKSFLKGFAVGWIPAAMLFIMLIIMDMIIPYLEEPRYYRHFINGLTEKMDSAQDGKVLLAESIKNWDTVCYWKGKKNIPNEIRRSFGLPKETHIILLDDTDYRKDIIQQDESALVFYNSQTHEVQTRFISQWNFKPYPLSQVCFSGQDRIYIQDLKRLDRSVGERLSSRFQMKKE